MSNWIIRIFGNRISKPMGFTKGKKEKGFNHNALVMVTLLFAEYTYINISSIELIVIFWDLYLFEEITSDSKDFCPLSFEVD